mmetsp:Transcript_16917/g.52168  ORF Transcript_16917/g.52168 Transcript_16917/m.52168 type:complete len:456 (-) Transcript_16917:1140-2507(-)
MMLMSSKHELIGASPIISHDCVNVAVASVKQHVDSEAVGLRLLLVGEITVLCLHLFPLAPRRAAIVEVAACGPSRLPVLTRGLCVNRGQPREFCLELGRELAESLDLVLRRARLVLSEHWRVDDAEDNKVEEHGPHDGGPVVREHACVRRESAEELELYGHLGDALEVVVQEDEGPRLHLEVVAQREALEAVHEGIKPEVWGQGLAVLLQSRQPRAKVLECRVHRPRPVHARACEDEEGEDLQHRRVVNNLRHHTVAEGLRPALGRPPLGLQEQCLDERGVARHGLPHESPAHHAAGRVLGHVLRPLGEEGEEEVAPIRKAVQPHVARALEHVLLVRAPRRGSGLVLHGAQALPHQTPERIRDAEAQADGRLVRSVFLVRIALACHAVGGRAHHGRHLVVTVRVGAPERGFEARVQRIRAVRGIRVRRVVVNRLRTLLVRVRGPRTHVRVEVAWH